MIIVISFVVKSRELPHLVGQLDICCSHAHSYCTELITFNDTTIDGHLSTNVTSFSFVSLVLDAFDFRIQGFESFDGGNNSERK